MTAATVLNCTPHEITIVSSDDVEYAAQLRKYVVREGIEAPRVLAVIPKSGILLNVQFEDVDAEPVNLDGVTIPTRKRQPASVDPIPGDADYVVVSALYASAITDPAVKARLLTVGDPVYTRDGRTVLGCLCLNRVGE